MTRDYSMEAAAIGFAAVDRAMARESPAPVEPEWYPLWVHDGDDSCWRSRGNGTDGPWTVESKPVSGDAIGPRLEVMHSELGLYRFVDLKPEQAMALRQQIDEWLQTLAQTGGA